MPELYPRLAETPLLESLADSPATLLHGPRQCGKTTLARLVGDSRGYEYVNFDNEDVRAAAVSDPIGFAARLSERTILDEVQYVPSLFPALKLEIDARRTPGRFLMTGSSQVLLLPALSESLAGRMEILTLHPLSQSRKYEAEPPVFSTTCSTDHFLLRGLPGLAMTWLV